MNRVRVLCSLLSVTVVAGLLAACSAESKQPEAQDTARADDCAPAGAVSDSVEVEGKFGSSDVTLTSPAPIADGESVKLQRTVLIEGEGSPIQEGDAVSFQITEINGVTGETLRSYTQPVEYDAQKLPEWFVDMAGCSAFGDRVAGVIPSMQVLGEGAADQLGLKDEDPLLFVVDVWKPPATLKPEELLEKAAGQTQSLPSGLPSVSLAEDGSPTITMPEGVSAPDTLTIHTLIKGDGEQVRERDRVYVHYRGVIWRTGEEFDSSWSRGQAIDFVTSGVIGGFRDALVGQTVGSQMLSIVPAEDGGYGAKALVDQGHEPDDVMVFVLDILGTVHAN